MYTQRKKERRCSSRKMSFPLVTNGGYEVEKDRRSTPDRRLGNIHPELVEVEKYQGIDDLKVMLSEMARNQTGLTA